MATATPPAVLLGGANATALPAALSLGRRGIAVHAIGGPTSYVRHSRFCSQFVDLGGGEKLQERWLEWLERHGPRGAVLLPCGDDGLEVISRHRADLIARGYQPWEANDEVSLAMLDKERTYDLARKAGVLAPLTFPASGPDAVEALDGQLSYPCGVKPLHSHLLQRLDTQIKLFVAHDREELKSALARAAELRLEVLVTELLSGPDDQIFGLYSYIDEAGEPLVTITLRKLRQHPIHFGTASYRVNEWDSEVAEVGQHFLKGVGYRGYGHVELKRDAGDGRVKLIECNARLGAASPLLISSGVDTPYLCYRRALGRPAPPMRPVQGGKWLWEPGPDTRAFLAYRRAGELTLGGWARSLAHRQQLPYFSPADPVPSLVSSYRTTRRLAPRLLRRALRSASARRASSKASGRN